MPGKRTKRYGLQAADRIALVAVGGIALSVVVWIAFAAVDTVVHGGMPFSIQVFAPDTQQELMRLSAIVLVLAATLIAQLLYSGRLRAEERLHMEQQRVQQMYDHSPDAMVCIDADGRVVYANPASQELAGMPPESAPSTACHAAIWGLAEPCEGCLLPDVKASLDTRERTFRDEFNGFERWLQQLIYPVLDDAGAVGSFVEVVRDTTELRRAEDALKASHRQLEERVTERTRELVASNEALAGEVAERERTAAALSESEERYRQLVESSPDMVLVHHAGRIVFVNSPGAQLMGLDSPSEALGMSVEGLWETAGSGMTREELVDCVMRGELPRPVAARLNQVGGTQVDIEVSVGKLIYEGKGAVQCVVRDITERVNAQETIRHMAYYDPLTELPNRALFRDRLRHALAQAHRRDEIVAIVFVDLDDFKAINDTLGHVVGDGVLREVGRRLSTLVREEDTVARQGGDEFTIIARVTQREDALVLADRVFDSLRPGVEVGGYELHVSAAIGIATYPDDGQTEVDLMRSADVAMYSAKEWGHNVVRLYEPQMSESALDRLELEATLRGALERGEFELYYQPQVDMRNGKLVGVEALLRWNHPTQGVLTPAAFLWLAEQAGFMGQIGRWVLESACRQAIAWLDDGYDFGRVAVNVSAKEFVQQNVVTNVRRILEETGLEPGRLELEITETTAMYNVEQVFEVLTDLRALGVRVAIDDFGTGYSSMSYLTRFPIQTLKIAQDFMRDVHVDQQSAAIASMLIQLCRELRLDVVAEGVEHQDQLDFLREHDCYIIQGYVFSHPVPAGEIVGLLEVGLEVDVEQELGEELAG